MSFSSSALTNTKARLRPTVTRLTRPDGKVLLEREGESEEISQSAPGYVVDTKPDLTVSQVSLSYRYTHKRKGNLDGLLTGLVYISPRIPPF